MQTSFLEPLALPEHFAQNKKYYTEPSVIFIKMPTDEAGICFKAHTSKIKICVQIHL